MNIIDYHIFPIHAPVWQLILTSEHFLDDIWIEDKQHVWSAQQLVDFDTRPVFKVKSLAHFVDVLHFEVTFERNAAS